MMYVCFFKQKTAYEVRISDWSSDVCSSDLGRWPTCSARVMSPRSRWRPKASPFFRKGAPMLLENKVVLVTGASAGIGRAVAIGCARHGADVAINFGRDTAGAAAAVAAIEALGRKAVAIQGDVAEPERKSTRLNSSH